MTCPNPAATDATPARIADGSSAGSAPSSSRVCTRSTVSGLWRPPRPSEPRCPGRRRITEGRPLAAGYLSARGCPGRPGETAHVRKLAGYGFGGPPAECVGVAGGEIGVDPCFDLYPQDPPGPAGPRVGMG